MGAQIEEPGKSEIRADSDLGLRPPDLTLRFRNVPGFQRDLFGADQACVHRFGIDSLPQLGQQFGFLRQKTKSRQRVQVQAVIGASDQEEKVRRPAIW